MKVFLLEHPRRIAPERCNDIANAPLSSSLVTGCIAGMVQSLGHRVEIAEGFLDQLTYDEIHRRVAEFKPEILGVHLVYVWGNNEELFAFLRRLKTEGLVGKIVGYGYYPTFAYEEILKACPEFDGLFVGEPELSVAEWLAAGKPVPGMAWLDGNATIQIRRRDLNKDLDSLPDPVRTPAMMRMAEVNIEGSRGCYGKCTFCYINPYYGENSCWRPKSPERVIAEIDRIIAEYGPRKFYFTDPNFFGPGNIGRERALKLAAMLKERNIKFGIEGRVNDIRPEVISALVDAGFTEMLIGLESGRDESLTRLNKMTTVAQNEEALRVLRANGIEPSVGFIMFEPDSSLADVRTNFEFLKRNDLLKNIFTTANVLYHPQIILQGTSAYRTMQQEGRLILRDTTYEGRAAYSNAAVARLAEIIGRMTNHLFIAMNRVWQGQLNEPSNAAELYQVITKLLVERFENTLARLEAGERIDEPAADNIVAGTNSKIEAIFVTFPKGERYRITDPAIGCGCGS
ncbi:Radical SAM superfamily enzyme YgiQ, UPF0313 family [Dehalogenimonas formicexedens]|uniref:Radical SAM superfamily enzyme YgiQ, UPF0313 family n=1 Tax=Dehalogenimonas formicexedens TaxID=1839801 RepID=A0A1P8F5Q0_9CHLR|nr:radical SAM protein [Dehalogenimonas formicexedens]APV43803.1 Radical SAM superfamily enzyme YgiQ, UPF0313 family [Dehalogenimonas formicexedens]